MLPWDLILFYLLLILGSVSALYYCYTHYANFTAWDQIPEISYASLQEQTSFTIIVAARNEELDIEICLQSILDQNYPIEKFEIIFVDDHSTDKTLSLVRGKFKGQIKILALENLEEGFGKKVALQTAIHHAKGNWIVTTDADCRLPEQWLKGIDNCIQTSPNLKFITGPVLFQKHGNSSLGIFQELDILGMMGVTAGGIARHAAYLANGANLAYDKAVFQEIGGFSGIDQKASGDDMLLMHKIVQRYPKGVGFAKSKFQSVETKVEKTLSDFFQQRLRWASKGDKFQSSSTWWQMVMVFLFSLTIVSTLVLSIFMTNLFLGMFIIFYVIKFNADFIYLLKFARYFEREKLARSIVWGSLAHAFYISIIGIWAQFYKSYEWKGRATR